MDSTDDEDLVLDSDPSGNSAEGLAGEMGISSERSGPVRGRETEHTHAAEESTEPSSGDLPPEQSADPATGEPDPENALPPHRFDTGTAQGHSHG